MLRVVPIERSRSLTSLIDTCRHLDNMKRLHESKVKGLTRRLTQAETAYGDVKRQLSEMSEKARSMQTIRVKNALMKAMSGGSSQSYASYPRSSTRQVITATLRASCADRWCILPTAHNQPRSQARTQVRTVARKLMQLVAVRVATLT
jgi:hypothetical protein